MMDFLHVLHKDNFFLHVNVIFFFLLRYDATNGRGYILGTFTASVWTFVN